MVANPMPWSIALGARASALSFKLPGPVGRTVAMLADAASPVALFTFGAVLARSQMNQHEQVPAREYVPVALAKLLVAALPNASNVSLLAERFGANNGRVARIVLVSTALAFLVFQGRWRC
jgi:predicted permease